MRSPGGGCAKNLTSKKARYIQFDGRTNIVLTYGTGEHIKNPAVERTLNSTLSRDAFKPKNVFDSNLVRVFAQ